MRRNPRALAFLATCLSIIVVVALLIVAGASATPATRAAPNQFTPPTNVNVSQRHLNESEEAIAVNPTTPNNIVIFTNIGHGEAGLTAGMFLAVSFDGGATGNAASSATTTTSATRAVTRAFRSTSSGTCS